MPLDNHNDTQMFALYEQAVNASASGDIPQLLQIDDKLNILANNAVLYLYIGQPEYITAATSNLQGFTFDPGLFVTLGGSAVQYFASFYTT